MTTIANDPQDFALDMVDGFTSAYARYVRAVPDGGVLRHARPGDRATRLVLGGGSGHFPWTAGFVGHGMADAAVLGNVFASPSTEQIHRLVRALPDDAPVLFCYGNYAGDVLNFTMAQDRLKAEGIDCRSVQVTDDIASADSADAAIRRGIAGSVVVFKTTGAAATRGDGIDDVESIARRTNDRTRSIGVAFSGCTLPGAAEPLFRVDADAMAIGLGIHGEPGIRTVARMPAEALARTLVDALLAEAPGDGPARAAVLLNGLGATGQDELFVLWSGIARHLARAGVEVVLPEVGEYVTSLNMAGCSLSLTWLDDTLEELWAAPADTPALRRAPGDARPPAPGPRAAAPAVTSVREAAPASALDPASDPDPAAAPAPDAPGAEVARRVLAAMLSAVSAAEDELGRLDAVAGDGDHGIGMTRGLRAALDAAGRHAADPGSLLRAAGAAWSDKSGGTSGALWGVLLDAVGSHLAGDAAGPGRTARRLSGALDHGVARLQAVGHAAVGDKTMLDALVPFAETFRAQVQDGATLAAAWTAAAQVATRAAERTAELRPRLGRARPLAERSLGSPDPGATSLALCLAAAGPVFAEAPCG
jgi:dihydroxyacetone kinase